jgi:hypothetical protein
VEALIMNTKALLAGAVLVGTVEIVLLTQPDIWDDFVYGFKGFSEWMQSRNGWLSKPAPAKL